VSAGALSGDTLLLPGLGSRTVLNRSVLINMFFPYKAAVTAIRERFFAEAKIQISGNRFLITRDNESRESSYHISMSQISLGPAAKVNSSEESFSILKKAI